MCVNEECCKLTWQKKPCVSEEHIVMLLSAYLPSHDNVPFRKRLILSQVNKGNHLNTWIIAYAWTLHEQRTIVIWLLCWSEECAAPLQETLTSGVFDTSHESWMNLAFFCCCSINLKIAWSLSVASSPSASTAPVLMLMFGHVKDSEIMEKWCLAGFLITVSQVRSMCRTRCSSQVR